MTADIINLRLRRKRAARADERAQSAANAALHGTPPAVRDLAEARADKARRDLDAHKIDTPPGLPKPDGD